MAPFSQFSFMQATEKRAALGVEKPLRLPYTWVQRVRQGSGAELMN